MPFHFDPDIDGPQRAFEYYGGSIGERRSDIYERTIDIVTKPGLMSTRDRVRADRYLRELDASHDEVQLALAGFDGSFCDRLQGPGNTLPERYERVIDQLRAIVLQ